MGFCQWPAQAPHARLCGLDRYVPLAELLDYFYVTQHEIGYLEGGSLVAFMVDTWGWEWHSWTFTRISTRWRTLPGSRRGQTIPSQAQWRQPCSVISA